MDERADDEQDPGTEQRFTREPVPALVEAQVETARAGVFRAYVRAREQARRLAEDGPGEPRDPRRRTS